jgi:hypothetical protein
VLTTRFGNVGLAAAAYNAGPDRVEAWLAGRRGLPAETLDYVRAVTGKAVRAWAPPGAHLIAAAAGPGPRRSVAKDDWEEALLRSLTKSAPAGSAARAADTKASSASRPDKLATAATSGSALLRGRGRAMLCPTCVVQRVY